MREVVAKTLTTEKLLTLKRKRKQFESLGQSVLLWEKTLGFFYQNTVDSQCCVKDTMLLLRRTQEPPALWPQHLTAYEEACPEHPKGWSAETTVQVDVVS